MCLGRNESYREASRTVRGLAGDEMGKGCHRGTSEQRLRVSEAHCQPCTACLQEQGNETCGNRSSGEPQALAKGLLHPVQLLQGTLGELRLAFISVRLRNLAAYTNSPEF